MRILICLFAFVAVVGLGVSRELGKTSKPATRTSVATTGAAQPAPAADVSGRKVTLQGDGRGHFKVEARIDGRRVDALVDTGASLVVLNESSAARVGIFPSPADYTGRTTTANGTARYAPVMLSRLEVNGITVNDVQAAVMSDEALKVNLLGMSFLAKVKFTHDRGRLVLEK